MSSVKKEGVWVERLKRGSRKMLSFESGLFLKL